MSRQVFRRRDIEAVIILAGLVLALLSVPARRLEAADVPVIAAASSLQFAVADITSAFKEDTGESIALSFGSSGNLARQIRQGAPFEMFLSADEVFVRELASDGFAEDEGRIYAVGRLAIIMPREAGIAADGTLEALREALAEGRVTRFAIANPEHAPYGARAEEVLRRKGLWDDLVSKLVYGENIAQAAQFATSGSAQGGIVAYSLAISDQVAAHAEHALIPAEWHGPLNQRVALMKQAGPVARAFYGYLQEPRARAILEAHGFATPARPS